MTVIIGDKDASNEEFNNPEITLRDIGICSIRQIPLPRIVNHIYRSSPRSDIWLCENCKTRGDKWLLMMHLCKALLSKPLTKAELQKIEEKRLEQVDRSKWISPVCKDVSDNFYKKFHYAQCIPESGQSEESGIEICEDCGKSINSYYRAFHHPNCERQLLKQVKVLKSVTEEPLAHINELRIIRKYSSSNYTNDLSEFMKNKAVLEQGYWVLYCNGCRIGIVEKETKKELTSWDPQADKEEGL